MKIARRINTVIQFYFKIGIYFFSLFLFSRIIFFIFLKIYHNTFSFQDIINTVFHGFYLDFATFSYAALLPILFYGASTILNNNLVKKISIFIIYLFIILWSIISVVEILLYREWKIKLGVTAFLHFKNPSEVFRTASIFETSVFLIMLFIFIFFGFYLFKKFQISNIKNDIQNKISALFFTILCIGISILGLRGGWQPIPIQVSDASFSNKLILNDVAINPLFNFFANVRNYINNESVNPFNKIKIKIAQKSVDSFFIEAKKINSTSQSLFESSVSSPNIVFVIMESVSANCSKFFGGDNYMPFLDSLAENGLAFTKCFPAGHLSDQGMASIFSGFPASPNIGILMMPNKSIKLPLLNQFLKPLHYESNYYMGGQLTYGNIKNYLFQGGFDHLYDENNIENKNYFKQRLGFCDADMATVFSQGIKKSKEPFLNCWFTISSHNPYDIPGKKIQLTEIENDYVNTVAYFDSALKSFFEKVKTEKWYSNTLFVIVSDHSHASQKNLSNTDPEYHHIPLLFFGEVLNKNLRHKKIENIVSQLDISYTILESLGINTENKFPYSKSLLNTNLHFAPYTYHNGAGFIIDSSVCCFDMNNLNKPVFEKNNSTFLNYFTNAFHQTVYEDYRLK